MSGASCGGTQRDPRLEARRARKKLANPTVLPGCDMPGHRFRRGGGGVWNILADLLAVEPAAAMGIARLADQADVVALPQHRIAVGRKEGAGKFDRRRQLAHQKKRA